MNDDIPIQEALTAELVRSFDDREFRRFMGALGPPDLGPSLLISGSREALIFDAVQVLARQSRLDRKFFLVWQQFRPHKHAEIAAIARRLGFTVPDVATPTQTLRENRTLIAALVLTALACAAVTVALYRPDDIVLPRARLEEYGEDASPAELNPPWVITIAETITPDTHHDEIEDPLDIPIPEIDHATLFPGFGFCEFAGLDYGVVQLVAYQTDSLEFYFMDDGYAWINSGYGPVKWSPERDVIVVGSACRPQVVTLIGTKPSGKARITPGNCSPRLPRGAVECSALDVDKAKHLIESGKLRNHRGKRLSTKALTKENLYGW